MLRFVAILILISCDTSNIRKNYPIDQTAQLIKRQGGYQSYKVEKDLSSNKEKEVPKEVKNNGIPIINDTNSTNKHCIESYIYRLYPVETNNGNIISTNSIKKDGKTYKYNIVFDGDNFIAKAFTLNSGVYEYSKPESESFENKIKNTCK